MNTAFVARAFAVGLIAVALGSPALAQNPGPGLTWIGSSGSAAGSFSFACLPDSVSATNGELVTVTVWGDPLAPFGLFLSASANQCLPLAGFTGAIVLDPPVALLAAGALTQLTPCLSCPPGFEPLTFTIPPFLPPGTKFGLQAFSFGAMQPGFTRAIAVKTS
jgi:hypothetical protein